MSFVLLDQNAPKGLRAVLIEHDVRLARQMGWDTLENGDLIDAAEKGGFDVMVTADQNLAYQQNRSGRKLALVVLDSNQWPIVQTSLDKVVQAVNNAVPGSYQAVSFDRPPLLRRPYNPSADC